MVHCQIIRQVRMLNYLGSMNVTSLFLLAPSTLEFSFKKISILSFVDLLDKYPDEEVKSCSISTAREVTQDFHDGRAPTIAQLLQEKTLYSFSEWPKVFKPKFTLVFSVYLLANSYYCDITYET